MKLVRPRSLFSLLLGWWQAANPSTSRSRRTSSVPRSCGPLLASWSATPSRRRPSPGGTLAVAASSATEPALAVAADPDRDRVYVVNLASRAVRFRVDLPSRWEPGRVAVDDSGHAFVVLRRAGGVAQIDLAYGRLTLRTACDAPWGIAFDKNANAMRVACANGELVTMPIASALIQGRDFDRMVERRSLGGVDLRDVVVTAAGAVYVTRFRTAELIRVMATQQRTIPRDARSPEMNVAWRAIAAPGLQRSFATDLELAMVAQEPSPEPVKAEPGGYGTGGEDCGGGLIGTRLWAGGRALLLPQAVLPVDLATNGDDFVVVAAGNRFVQGLPQVFVLASDSLWTTMRCGISHNGTVEGQAIAVAYNRSEIVVQSREPSALHLMAREGNRFRVKETIRLATDDLARSDTGHDIFHANAGGNIACASCHPEGGDDGRTWIFKGAGPRRTPSLRGTLASTEPFHWDGEMKDLRTLVDKVFVERMSGPPVSAEQLGVLKGFLDALPPPRRLRANDEATARGQATFQERCASCHAGPLFTNNQSLDVGTGGVFQVPSLVGLAWRAPFLHTGCANTLEERFDPACGGASHGVTADLGASQTADLIKFLETL